MEPLVLVPPGMMCDARVFSPQINELSRDVGGVQVASIAAGETIRDMAGMVLDQAPPARFALAGHSMGGIVAMEVLRRAPERVSRIALISTTPLAETPPEQAAWREPHIVKAQAGRLDEAMAGSLPADNFAPPTPARNTILQTVIDMAYGFGGAEASSASPVPCNAVRTRRRCCARPRCPR